MHTHTHAREEGLGAVCTARCAHTDPPRLRSGPADRRGFAPSPSPGASPPPLSFCKSAVALLGIPSALGENGGRDRRGQETRPGPGGRPVVFLDAPPPPPPAFSLLRGCFFPPYPFLPLLLFKEKLVALFFQSLEPESRIPPCRPPLPAPAPSRMKGSSRVRLQTPNKVLQTFS